MNSIREYLERQVRKTTAKIKTGVEVNAKLIEKEKPDAVIIASGIVPLVPQIKGIDGSHAMSAEEVLWGQKEPGNTVVVVGGEMVACETAELLADKGKKVTVVRRGPKMAVKVGPVQRGRLLTRLREKGVHLIPGVQKYEDPKKV
jgi:pyruvate/2-oxoglutarate dehydrogenase complex dihydrolipoamide dehydrogenase (E3) component